MVQIFVSTEIVMRLLVKEGDAHENIREHELESLVKEMDPLVEVSW